MALAAARVPYPPLRIEECVPVFAVAEEQLEDAEHTVNVRNGVDGTLFTHSAQRSATRADYELGNAFHGVGYPCRRLRPTGA